MQLFSELAEHTVASMTSVAGRGVAVDEIDELHQMLTGYEQLTTSLNQ